MRFPTDIAVSDEGTVIAVWDDTRHGLTVRNADGEMQFSQEIGQIASSGGVTAEGHTYAKLTSANRVSLVAVSGPEEMREIAAFPFDGRGFLEGGMRGTSPACPNCAFAVSDEGEMALALGGPDYAIRLLDPSGSELATLRRAVVQASDFSTRI